MGKYKKITIFKNHYRFLSNFAESGIFHQGEYYRTAEHLYQALKTDNPSDKYQIRKTPFPDKAKRIGQEVDLRPDWEEVKDMIMLLVVMAKFKQNSHLAKELKATGNAILIEGNYWHDNYWGRCTCPKCKDVQAHNMLGRILMRVRRTL